MLGRISPVSHTLKNWTPAYAYPSSDTRYVLYIKKKKKERRRKFNDANF